MGPSSSVTDPYTMSKVDMKLIRYLKVGLPNVGIGIYCLFSVEICIYCCLTLGKSIVVQVLFTHDPYSIVQVLFTSGSANLLVA